MKTKIQKTMTKQIPIPPQLAESLCIPDGVLELHQMAAGPLIMKGEMTAAEVLAMLDDLHALTEHLLECLQDACGPCMEYCMEDCPLRCRELLRLPNRLLARAGIPENARLCAVPDPENQCIYIEESAPCGCVPGQAAHTEGMLLDAGICLRELNRHLRKGDVVYGGK